MAKVAFTVDNGLVPGHTDADLGDSTAKFRDVHISRDANIDADVNVGGDVVVGASGDVTIDGTSLQSSGGLSATQAIAYSIALG